MKIKSISKFIFIVMLSWIILTSCTESGTLEKKDRKDEGSTYSGNETGGSGGSGIIVNDLYATKLLKDKITLNWISISGVNKYKIYRYISKAVTTADKTFEIIDNNPAVSGKLFEIEDPNSPLVRTAYFYKIACIIDNIEYDKSNFVFGICNDTKDEYEDNDTLTGNIAQTFINNPIIYSCFADVNIFEGDIDWYKYHFNNSGILNLNIKIASNSGFKNGQLKIRYYLNGEYQGEAENIEIGKEGGYNTSFTYNGGEQADLYYKIYIDTNASELPLTAVISEYIVTIGF